MDTESGADQEKREARKVLGNKVLRLIVKRPHFLRQTCLGHCVAFSTRIEFRTKTRGAPRPGLANTTFPA